MEFVNRGIWNLLVNGYTISTQVVENKTIEKPFESRSQKEIRRVEYDAKAMNKICSSLNCDEYFRASTCTMVKEMWDLIQLTH